MPIKVYLNRDNDITGWYPDSALVGLKVSESGRYQFIETSDSNQAIVPVTYHGTFWPGRRFKCNGEWDQHGVYVTNWEIAIAGPPNNEELPRGFVSHLLSHEQMHLAYMGGDHRRTR
ncbi:MAG: hypothetical protein U5K00_14690 [Melioribacteraceae bacterium]|nr:hypothetical protein [Melioribacteraceae bacterium]